MKQEYDNRLIRQQPLVDQVFDILKERISQGEYVSGSQLPPEGRLAEELSVSRTTVGKAIARLVDLRLVQRRRGVGTFVRSFVEIPNPLNEFVEFSILIKEIGAQPGYRTWAEFIIPTVEVLETLKLEPKTQVLKQRKLFTADNTPIIFVENYIPIWVFEHAITREDALKPDLTEKFIGFFEITCNQKISHFVSTISADIYESLDFNNNFFDINSNTPVLVIKETGFNTDDIPIVYSKEFHPGNRMTFQWIRRVGKKFQKNST
jgi:GntR family transcriptional regulator